LVYENSIGDARPYGYDGDMIYINLETMRANVSIGLFRGLPWSLNPISSYQYWKEAPAILQVSSSLQYLFMGTSEANRFGGFLWRMQTQGASHLRTQRRAVIQQEKNQYPSGDFFIDGSHTR
jgi:hypothetical protein